MSETHTRYETREETDADENVVERTEEINKIYIVILAVSKKSLKMI